MEQAAGVPKLKATSLDLFYGAFHALKDVTLDIQPCRVTAVIGPSGCGKSTLLRAFNRMNDLIPEVKVTGCVLLDGIDIYRGDMSAVQLRKRVGMVFQRPNPFPLSVFDNVAFGPRAHGMRDKRGLAEIVEHSLRSARLWDQLKGKLSTRATDLDLGDQQLLCFARLLAVKPDVILLDEPCSALDPASTLAVEDLMRDLKESYTIVIVTHNMQQAARASDECVYMLLGEIIEHGQTTQVFTTPRDERTEQYVTGRLG